MNFPIYMDNHATTPLDPRVLESMMPYLTTEFGNASSTSHPLGWHAEKSVENARKEMASFINADPKEIFYTGGATESNNMVLKGIMEIYAQKGDHLITQVTEHKCILECAKFLEKQGKTATVLGVDETGRISLKELEKAITDKTVLVSIMFANNEIGTIQPIREIGKLCKERGVLFHVDGAQAAGKIPIDVEALGIDLLSFSAHKMYGPKGIGALYIRSKNPRVRIAPLLHGGGQEQGLRSGTLNVPGIVGFAKACEVAREEMHDENARILKLRNRLQKGLENALDHVYVNGHPKEKLCGNLNMSFLYTEGESLIMGVNGEIAISSGSACTSRSTEPSYVLKAMGLPGDRMHSAVRFGLGRFNTEREIDYVIDRIVLNVNKLRQLSPVYPGPAKRNNSASKEA